MALPSVSTPTYELTLPSEDKKIKFRPFLVREEKILLMAMESEKTDEVFNATKTILDNCTFNTLDIENLPLFDIEYIFLKIRSKSIGETAKFKVLCPDDKKTLVDVEVDISNIEVNVDDEHTNKIVLDESRNLGVILNYPNMNISKVGTSIANAGIETIFDIIISCIDTVFEGEKIYPSKDSTKEELREFLDSLSQEAFDELKKFFDTMPQLRHEIEVENPITKVKSKIVFQGLQDFFPSASPITA